MRVGPLRRLSTKELMLLNYGSGEALESPLDSKEIKPVDPKGNQPWIFIGRTDVEAETPILWPPDMKSCLIWKDPDAGKDWGQEAIVKDREAWRAAVHGVAKNLKQLSNWTTFRTCKIYLLIRSILCSWDGCLWRIRANKMGQILLIWQQFRKHSLTHYWLVKLSLMFKQ